MVVTPGFDPSTPFQFSPRHAQRRDQFGPAAPPSRGPTTRGTGTSHAAAAASVGSRGAPDHRGEQRDWSEEGRARAEAALQPSFNPHLGLNQDAEAELRAAAQAAQWALLGPGLDNNPKSYTHIMVPFNMERIGMQNFVRGVEIGRGRDPATGRNPITFDERYTLGNLMGQYYRMDDQHRANVQQLLVRAGLLPSNKVNENQWGRVSADGSDYHAWNQALWLAARTNRDVFDLLDELGEGVSLEDALARDRPRRPDVQLTSPEDAARMADDLGQELMGRKLSDSEKKRVVSLLHSRERREQSAAIDVQMSETGGGTLTTPTSPKSAIEATIESEQAQEVQGHQQVQQFNSLLSMFGAGGMGPGSLPR